jgi:hypothetical protein
MQGMADTLLIAAITGTLGFATGVAADWIKQWSGHGLHATARNDVRKALRAELAPIIVSLNFYILNAIEAVPNERDIAVSYTTSVLRFSFPGSNITGVRSATLCSGCQNGPGYRVGTGAWQTFGNCRSRPSSRP